MILSNELTSQAEYRMMLPSLSFSRNLRGNPIEIGMLNTPVRSNTEKRDGIDDDTSINLTDFAAERDAFLSHLYNNPQGSTYQVNPYTN